MGIIQPHNVLKTWQGWPFSLAKRTSGQPLGTDVVPVARACQRRIDVTCQNGHAKIAPKPWAWNAQSFWFSESAFFQDALRLWSTSRVLHWPGLVLSSLRRGAWTMVPALHWPLFQDLQPPACVEAMCSLRSQVQRWRGLCDDSLERIGEKQVLGKPEVCYPELDSPCFTQPSPNLYNHRIIKAGKDL